MNSRINFEFTTDFLLEDENLYVDWIANCIQALGFNFTELNYQFCSDEELFKINKEHLNHDTYTDIITFDHSIGNTLQADIFISVERVRDNAVQLQTLFEDEIKRVMIHGVLHCCGFADKTDEEQASMRKKEDECIRLFHVEH